MITIDINRNSFLSLQKARLTRIHMAKNASGNAFINSKKKAEERKLAREAGMEVDFEEDLFELQHHHLLNCLEKTTVSVTLHPSHYVSHVSPPTPFLPLSLTQTPLPPKTLLVQGRSQTIL